MSVKSYMPDNCKYKNISFKSVKLCMKKCFFSFVDYSIIVSSYFFVEIF